MNQKVLLTLLFILFSVFANEVFAAGMGMGPPNPPCGSGPFPPCPVPLDGGITILAGAGIALAAKKYYNKQEK